MQRMSIGTTRSRGVATSGDDGLARFARDGTGIWEWLLLPKDCSWLFAGAAFVREVAPD